ncbi:MAG: starch-binding protein [Muribaculaceae bacterium]|nr:starch-binding protein [Muribaculaceae bacterium]
MKKLLLLAACAVATASASAATLFINNEVGYADAHLYGWADELPELYGGWPGAASNGEATVDGKSYLKFDIPATAIGNGYNLIYNDGSAQIKDLYLVLENKDYYLTATSAGLVEGTDVVTPPADENNVTLYTLDKTGWAETYIYAYSPVGGLALFGEWPGKKLSDTVSVDGVTYKTIDVASTSSEYVLIWNNNAGEQVEVDGTVWTPTSDIAFEVTATSAAKIETPKNPELQYVALYTLNKTDWDALYVYAYNPDKAPELFGGWPGKALTETVTINGVVYNTVEVPVTDKEYVLIWNDNNGTQVEVEAAVWTPNADAAFEVNSTDAFAIDVPVTSGVAEIESAEEGEAIYFNLQGVKVANPENGLYIKVLNGKSTKVVLN